MGEARGEQQRTKSRENAEHYRWGGPERNESDGWHLVKADGLSVIEEAMPPGAQETQHYHVRSRQFFYVLEGELSMGMGGEVVTVREREGVEVAPGVAHQAMNRGEGVVRFLVVSAPPSHEDRVEV